jgi:hypothetical protein
MTVAHDAATESATFSTVSPFTFSHTPSGTPRGILVVIQHGTVSTDLITGAVTYGGVAMTRISRAADTAGEPGATYAYFLGSGIPTGAQTVSITHSATATLKIATVNSMTAAANTAVEVSNVIQADTANPQLALNSAVSALRYVGVYSGAVGPTSLTLLGGMTAVHSHDFGAFCSRVDRETTASSGSFTIGYTAASDDVGMVAVAIREVQAYAQTFTDPLGLLDPRTSLQTAARGQTDGAGLIDSTIKVFTQTASITESLGFEDIGTYALDLPWDGLGIVDVLLRDPIGRFALSPVGLEDTGSYSAEAHFEPVGMSDLVSLTVVIGRPLAEALGLSDTRVQVQVAARALTDPAGLGGTVLQALTGNRAETLELGLTDSVEYDITGGGGSFLNREVIDTLEVVSSPSGSHVALRSHSDVMGLRDTAIGAAAFGQPVRMGHAVQDTGANRALIGTGANVAGED